MKVCGAYKKDGSGKLMKNPPFTITGTAEWGCYWAYCRTDL